VILSYLTIDIWKIGRYAAATSVLREIVDMFVIEILKKFERGRWPFDHSVLKPLTFENIGPRNPPLGKLGDLTGHDSILTKD
jgi:hypothetical protein